MGCWCIRGANLWSSRFLVACALTLVSAPAPVPPLVAVIGPLVNRLRSNGSGTGAIEAALAQPRPMIVVFSRKESVCKIRHISLVLLELQQAQQFSHNTTFFAVHRVNQVLKVDPRPSGSPKQHHRLIDVPEATLSANHSSPFRTNTCDVDLLKYMS